MNYHFCFFLVLLTVFLHTTGAVVVGIDFGTDLLKTAIVKPGFPFETVTDFNSRRLTPSSVAFYDGDRLFGDDAINIANKKPDLAFVYMKTLIGLNDTLKDDNILRQLRFPINTVKNERGTMTFKLGEPIHGFDEFSIEEIMGMLMGYVKAISEHFGNDKVRDCVITVPSFYTQYQRRAIIDAADSVGFLVLSLIDENTAAALQYGLDRVFENQTHIALIYNMGSTGTEVTLAEYTTINNKKKNTLQRKFEVLSKAWDTSLGSLLIDVELMKYFETKFFDKYHVNITNNARANARMRLSAKKTKKVLSANENMPVTIETLDGDHDLHIKELNRDIINRVVDNNKERFIKPIEFVLKMANITKDQLDVFEIIGGGTRIPRVKKVLSEYYGKELNVHLNGDESMALGATFRGANMSNSHKVRFVGMTDISVYQASVNIFEDPSRFVPTENQTEPWSKRAILFPIGSAYGSRKVVSFSRDKSFNINLHYDDTEMFPPTQDHNILSYNITGVEEACLKYPELGKPKIHLSFILTDSGIYNLTRADAEWEEYKMVEEKRPKKKASKIPPITPLKTNESDSTVNATNTNNENSENENEKENNNEKQENIENQEKGENVNSTETTNTNTTENAEQEEDDKPKMVKKKFTHTIHLNIQEYYPEGSLRPLSPEEKTEIKEKLKLLNRKDEEKKQLGQAKSELESAIYATREKLENTKGIDQVSVKSDLETITNKCNELEEWLYGDGNLATLIEYKDKHRELDKMINPILFRARELYERPKQVKKIQNYFTECRNKIEDWKSTKPQITEIERNETLFLINITEEEVNDLVAKQEEVSLTEEPVFTSNDIKYKMRTIKDKMNILNRKRPLPKPKPAASNSTESANNSTSSTNTTDTGTSPFNATAATPESGSEAPNNQTEPMEEFTEENEEPEL